MVKNYKQDSKLIEVFEGNSINLNLTKVEQCPTHLYKILYNVW